MVKEKKSEEKVEKSEDKFKDSELKQLDSMNPSRLEKLDACGIHTFEMLSAASHTELADAGIEELKARDELISEARSKIGWKGFKLGGDTSAMDHIPTGSKALDNLLGGGYQLGEATEIGGYWGLGKTTMCATAIATTWEKFKAPSIFLQTEIQQPFEMAFIEKIMSERGITGWTPEKGLAHKLCMSVSEQLWAVRSCDEMLKQYGMKLIIVDSLGAHFRNEYQTRDKYPERAQLITNHMKMLARMAVMFKLAVITTNQLYDNPASRFPAPVLALGASAHHSVGKIMMIRSVGQSFTGTMGKKTPKDQGFREITLLKALGRPVGSCLVKISDRGLDDVSEDEQEKAKKAAEKAKEKEGEE